MQQVTAQPKHQRTTDADEVDQSTTESAPEIVPDVADAEAGSRQTVAKLESAMAALRAAEKAMGRRTADGEFVPHAGDNQVLRERIKMAAQETAKACAMLTNSVSAHKALQERVDILTKKDQRLEAENTELKRRVQEQQATIVALEQASAEHAQVVPFRAAPRTEDGSVTAASH